MTIVEAQNLFESLSNEISDLENQKSHLEAKIATRRLIRDSVREQLKIVLKEASFEEIDSLAKS